ncbi:MAG: hypothetical protein ACI9IA_001845 [Enterobacterales bacterium]|jgi:hypothetical protein
MLLSSVTKHVKDQNWFAVWIDLLIVIVGVFIGIQVANWNESRVDEARATAYLERIVQDLDVDLVSIKDSMSFWKQVSDYGMSAIDYANTSENKSLSDWQILLAFFQASQLGEYYLTKTTYNELINAGDLGLINNINLRNKISQFYNEAAVQVFEERPLYREHIRGYIPIKLQNYIWEHCYSSDNSAKQTLINCKSPELELNINEVLQTIVHDKVLIRELRSWLSSQRVFFIVGGYQIKIANALKDVIQQELKSQNNTDKDASN